MDQLCECVLKGEWPIVSKAAEALLQSQLAANSPMSAGVGDVDMASLPPGYPVGEDGLPEDPSKAFKLKRVSPPNTLSLVGNVTHLQYNDGRKINLFRLKSQNIKSLTFFL